MFFKKNIKLKQTKKELKKAKKEKNRCKKLYSDWDDNEYNCGPLKFTWGIISPDDLYSKEPSFHSMNDLYIYYNRDTHKYLLDLETIYQFESTKITIDYLQSLCDKFYNFCKNQLDVNINPFQLRYYNNGDLFQADSITELYYKFKLFVKGYKQL